MGEVILTSAQLRTAADASDGVPTAAIATGFDRMDRVVGELQRRALGLRTAPILRVVDALPRLARDVARQTHKEIEVDISGAELELDRAILDRLGDPLVHLVRNAVDHGIEAPAARREVGKPAAGRIWIGAVRDKDEIRISVRDDGAGIDIEAVRARAVSQGLLHADLADDLPPQDVAALVFRAGLSTRDAVSEVSGRGVGMDAVKATIEGLGGYVELRSERGLGTTITLVVPITAAVQKVLLLGVSGEIVAVPISKVERIIEVEADTLEHAGHETFTLVDDEPLLVLDLAERIGLPLPPPTARVPLVLADIRGERVGIRIERLTGQEEIYVKPVPRLLRRVRALGGMTVLGDGTPVFVLDMNQLA